MTNGYRVKEYIFPAQVTSDVNYFSGVSHDINGEILKVVSTSNFTGSTIIKDIWNQTIANVTNASGTNTFSFAALTNTTGSFVVNGPITCFFASGTSGTGNMCGPVSVYYR